MLSLVAQKALLNKVAAEGLQTQELSQLGLMRVNAHVSGSFTPSETLDDILSIKHSEYDGFPSLIVEVRNNFFGRFETWELIAA